MPVKSVILEKCNFHERMPVKSVILENVDFAKTTNSTLTVPKHGSWQLSVLLSNIVVSTFHSLCFVKTCVITVYHISYVQRSKHEYRFNVQFQAQTVYKRSCRSHLPQFSINIDVF